MLQNTFALFQVAVGIDDKAMKCLRFLLRDQTQNLTQGTNALFPKPSILEPSPHLTTSNVYMELMRYCSLKCRHYPDDIQFHLFTSTINSNVSQLPYCLTKAETILNATILGGRRECYKEFVSSVASPLLEFTFPWVVMCVLSCAFPSDFMVLLVIK